MNIVPNIDVPYLENELLDSDKDLVIKDASFYKDIPQIYLATFSHKHGIYGLPTTELIAFLREHVVKGKTIEVGAGNGAIGRALYIPITDSRIMEDPMVKLMYQAHGQPTTRYPDDVIKMNAIEAIKNFKPDVVIGCWVTQIYKEEDGPHQKASVHGLDEEFIIDNVKKYIVIGNENIHGTKRILDKPHKTLTFPWLYSRSFENHDKNLIYIWEKEDHEQTN